MTPVDSSVWIDYFRGTRTPETDLLDAVLGAEPVLIGDLILTEVLQGFSSDAVLAHAQGLLGTLDVIVLGGAEICIQAAQNFRTLRRKGVAVRKTIDTIIATACIAKGYSLLYSDRDFDAFVDHLGLRSALTHT